MVRLWPFLRLKEECCLPHTFLSLRGREGGDTLIKCHAERDRTWHKVGRPLTAFPLFTPALCECVFVFSFGDTLRSPLRLFFATAEPESRPSDKIRNVRLPDSAPASHVTLSLFHTWTNDVPALSPNGRGYCVHDALYVVRRTESADCYTKISCLSHALENSLYYICLIANHKSCLCARDLTKHLTVPDMWNISICHPVFFYFFSNQG